MEEAKGAELKNESRNCLEMAHQSENLFNRSIRKNMEFNLGNANFSKNSFLKKLAERNPYIPLKAFVGFRNIKKWGATVNDIAESLKNSTFLKLNENKTRVTRVSPIPEDYCSEDRTICVEDLPEDLDNDWIFQILKIYGTLTYISFPIFRMSGGFKRFAFVEFKHVESVDKIMREMGSRMIIASLGGNEFQRSIPNFPEYFKMVPVEKTQAVLQQIRSLKKYTLTIYPQKIWKEKRNAYFKMKKCSSPKVKEKCNENIENEEKDLSENPTTLLEERPMLEPEKKFEKQVSTSSEFSIVIIEDDINFDD